MYSTASHEGPLLLSIIGRAKLLSTEKKKGRNGRGEHSCACRRLTLSLVINLGILTIIATVFADLNDHLTRYSYQSLMQSLSIGLLRAGAQCFVF